MQGTTTELLALLHELLEYLGFLVLVLGEQVIMLHRLHDQLPLVDSSIDRIDPSILEVRKGS